MSVALFHSLSSELTRYWRSIEVQARDNVLTFPGVETDRLGGSLFSNLQRGGFCTQLVTGNRSWNCRSAYFEAARSAARRGLRIERAFLLPDRHLRHDPALQEHVGRDAEAGIQTHVLFVGDLIPALAASSPGSLEFGLWDEETCCVAIYGTGAPANGPREWRISAREEDLRRARNFVDILMEKAQAVAPDGGGCGESPMLHEPVLLSAPLAYRVARDICRKDPASGRDCSWYHGVWQYLRALDILTVPQDHADFFFDALQALVRGGGYGRVLISGSADYAMLAHVLWAYGKTNAVADVTVVDICETPLVLSQWYAKTISAAIKTQASDILDYDTQTPFDVICTHSFLGYFTPASRRDLIAKWRQLLRPGGKVLTVNRIRPSVGAGVMGFTPEQARRFRETVLREAENWRDVLGVAPEELADLAETYTERLRVHPVRSREELVNLFEDGGFTVEHFDSGGVAGRVDEPLSGPTAPGNADYARIVASRI